MLVPASPGSDPVPLDGDARPWSKEQALARTPKQLARRRFDFDEAKARYLAGETTVQIAASYGVSSASVQAALRRMGVRLLKHWERPEPNVSPRFKEITDARREATHCKRGHAYTAEDTYINVRGHRECRRCLSDAQNARRRAEAARGLTREKWGLRRKPEPKCRNCPAPAVHLHHAIPRSKAPRVRKDLRNGLPLCRACHDGWHGKKVTLHRDLFTPEEWSFVSTVELTGERIEAWLDRHYPVRPDASEQAA